MLACRQKDDASNNPDCAAHGSMNKKLDCDSEAQTDEAIGAGCVREKEGATDVCCPPNLSGTPDTGAGGASGAGGAGGGTSVACTQKSDADNNPDCASFPDKPRKLDCDAAQTSSAVAAGCVPQSSGASDVCRPTSVSGVAG